MPDVNALWSRQTYEGSLGYPAPDTGITLWDGVTPVSGFSWFSSNPAQEKMQITNSNLSANFGDTSVFEWTIGDTTFNIPMIDLEEP